MSREILIASFIAMAAVPALSEEKPGKAKDELNQLIDKVLEAHGGEAKLNGLTAFIERTQTKTAKASLSQISVTYNFPISAEQNRSLSPATN